MKSKILILCPVVLLFLFLTAGCQKDEIDYADESIEVYNSPGIAVYKTQNEYFNYIAVKVDSFNNINPIPGYIKGDSRVLIGKDGKTSFSGRWKLQCGYVATNEMYIDYSFTNITIDEYIEYISEHSNVNVWSAEMLLKRTIDRNPFESFYYLDGITQGEQKFTLGELNEMIENGTIEKYFKKLK